MICVGSLERGRGLVGLGKSNAAYYSVLRFPGLLEFSSLSLPTYLFSETQIVVPCLLDKMVWVEPVHSG